MTDARPTGVVEGVPLLDLSHVASEDDLDFLSSIEKVAVVVVPEHLVAALHRIPMRKVASIVAVPQGANVRMHTGSLMVGGEGLAEPGGDNEVLVVTGALIVTSPVTSVGYRQIVVTGLVLAPRGSESALGSGLTSVTGGVVYYRYAEGQELRQYSGTVKVSGATLANQGGTPDDVLVAAGQLIVTGPVTEVGYQQIVLAGQLLAPRDSEASIAPALMVQGQVAWYSGDPRFLVGDETYGRAFFEMLDGPQELAILGDVTIEDDGLTPELLREKISDLTLVGRLTAPKALVPAFQVLATEKLGEIRASDGGTEPR
ncbi:MAG: hypothetical protein GEV10_19875 [Streptosporangiales bacterium]|nr:hypothetical protein [Streptosporangiales bacterium]